MTRLLLAALLAGTAAAPVLAQAGTPTDAAVAGGGSQRYIEVYGGDACPPSTEGEIVVCARKPESERYRIPKRLRETPGNGPNESWANKASAIEYVGRAGTGSCSPSGAGGWTGCWSQLMHQAEAERKSDVAASADVP